MFRRIQLSFRQKKCREGKQVTGLCEYYQSFLKEPSLQSSPHEVRFVVIDTETTGLNVKEDELLSIGSLEIQKLGIPVKSCQHILLNARKSKAQSIPIHGIIPSESTQGWGSRSAIAHFLQEIGSDILVAHHAGFDIGMIEREGKQIFGKSFKLYNRVIDTALLARRLEHPFLPVERIDLRQYSLDSLCNRYGITMQDRHTAWGDAFLTGQLLIKLIKDFKKRKNVSIKDLINR